MHVDPVTEHQSSEMFHRFRFSRKNRHAVVDGLSSRVERKNDTLKSPSVGSVVKKNRHLTLVCCFLLDLLDLLLLLLWWWWWWWMVVCVCVCV